ncbi:MULTISPECIES: HesA/MoeB/ThiF family protein [Roseobacteraceae]|uniref:Molybdopterin-synthase adenylyltransferase n=1 Tax=Pseudosulfitobacter pseudonitzschiae TaxID=1402135 RepID=A0A221JVZ1_9RHOB|nr:MULTISPECIES: molybdopterin-synthase adenylyltransferase MoeB [Roseobacteraceae]ASM70904.1 molybdopterin-synthase adenylyltransferase [Pseudosulfitobacter pseudonitzschiae]
MILVLGLALTLWAVGAVMGAPRSVRLNMMGLLYVAVLSLHLVLPDGHPLRLATGESAALWLILGGFVVLVLAYRWGLRRLRARAAKGQADIPVQAHQGPMGEIELNRYSRHIVLREIGGPGQVALKNARVLVVGAGGLGAPALQYLAAAGVGTLGVIDADVVEGSNLQRQVIHTDARIGMPKVFSAQAALEALNPFVTVRPYQRRFDEEIAAELVAEYDLVLDGTDNFATRYLVNRVAFTAGVPLVSGALSQWEGQLSVFDPARGAPCYQCVFPQAPAPGLAPSCAEAGVLGPLPGVVGAMMAVEAVKLLTGAGTPLRGEMLIYDALYGESRKITLARRGDCPVCGD